MTLGVLAPENRRITGGGRGFLTLIMSRPEVTLKVQGWTNLQPPTPTPGACIVSGMSLDSFCFRSVGFGWVEWVWTRVCLARVRAGARVRLCQVYPEHTMCLA